MRPLCTCGHEYEAHDDRLECWHPLKDGSCCTCKLYDCALPHPIHNPPKEK